MTIRQLFARERRCSRCLRIVPKEETAEGPYFAFDGRGWCMACLVELWAAAEFAVDELRLRQMFGGTA